MKLRRTFRIEVQRTHRVPSLFTQDEHTYLEHKVQERLPNLEPQI